MRMCTHGVINIHKYEPALSPALPYISMNLEEEEEEEGEEGEEEEGEEDEETNKQ